jgi:hypothetical protein
MDLLFDLLKVLQIEALEFLDLEKQNLLYVIPILGYKVALECFMCTATFCVQIFQPTIQ